MRWDSAHCWNVAQNVQENVQKSGPAAWLHRYSGLPGMPIRRIETVIVKWNFNFLAGFFALESKYCKLL
jgi:hypothetical protein